MKNVGIVLCFLALFISFNGCATRQASIARQDLADARAAIDRAKASGAAPATSPPLVEAERYYRLAQQNFNQEPRGRFLASLSQRKMFMQKASENAKLAEQEAELALRNSKTVTAPKPEIAATTMRMQIQALQKEVQQFKGKNALCQKEFAQLREQTRMLAQRVEEQTVGTASLSIPSGAKKVMQIQFTLSGGEEQVIFVLNRAFAPHTFILKGRKPRFVCDFIGTSPGRNIPTRINVGGDLIKRIRTGLHKGPQSKFRVVLDLTYPFKHRIQQKIIKEKHNYIVKFRPI